MPLIRLNLLTCAVAAVGVTLALASASRAANPTLYVHYNASCTFTIIGDDGKPVTSVPPGSYQVVVDTPFAFANDQATCAFVEFRLTGPGVSIITNLGTGDAETEQFVETLQPSSTYTLQDDGQPAQTRRTFTTTATGSASSGGSGSSGGSSSSTASSSSGSKSSSSTSVLGTSIATAFRGTLIGTVSSPARLTLTKGGRAVSNVKAGRYTFSIVDRTAKAGFTVQLVRKAATAVTGVAFVGTRKVTVLLKPGQWFFYTPSGKKNYFVVTG
jgi:hypothetical protein